MASFAQVSPPKPCIRLYSPTYVRRSIVRHLLKLERKGNTFISLWLYGLLIVEASSPQTIRRTLPVGLFSKGTQLVQQTQEKNIHAVNEV